MWLAVQATGTDEHQALRSPLPAVSDFDWEAFDFPDAGKQAEITKAQVAAVFSEGKVKLPRATAVKRLQDLTGRKKTLCYEALKANGTFAEHLTEEGGQTGWKP